MSKHFLVVTSRMGRSNEELGEVLMRTFVHTLARAEEKPLSLTLLNEGVRLACEGSSVLEDLLLLAGSGVPVKACGTCLDFLGLRDELRAGTVGTMQETVALLTGQSDVVTIG